MGSISDTFTRHHQQCDDAYLIAEEAVGKKQWPQAGAGLSTFVEAMRVHFHTEETQLFPAFEEATGMVGGPTAVMRMEHEQLRALLQDLTGAVERKDAEGFAGAGQTLLVLLQQHNLKEENMLYPMCDRAVGGDAALLDRLVTGLKAG